MFLSGCTSLSLIFSTTGAKWFEQIISDPYIKEKFVTCALEGLKKNTEDTVVRANDPASGLEHTATVLQPGIFIPNFIH